MNQKGIYGSKKDIYKREVYVSKISIQIKEKCMYQREAYVSKRGINTHTTAPIPWSGHIPPGLCQGCPFQPYV